MREGRERKETKGLEEKCEIEARREHDKGAVILYLCMNSL